MNYAKNPLNDEEKENQLLPSTDATKFPNLYCDLRLSKYWTKKLNTKKKLVLPNDVRRSITSRILELGMDFVDRDLGDINISWVKKFYCNFFRPTLDSVQLRGREVMITETAIEEALQCRHLPDGTCAHQQAELAIHSMTFDYEVLRRVIGLPDATWVMDANNTKPKEMLFAQLTREAKTWQMIFAHYVLPTTHFSEIPMEMLLLIGCVMEGKEVYFPQLIRQCMWRAHIRGLLPFPTLVTSMAALAEVPWLDDDVTPPPPDDDDKEVTIPWGGWVHEKPPARRRLRCPFSDPLCVRTPSPPPSTGSTRTVGASAFPPLDENLVTPQYPLLLPQRSSLSSPSPFQHPPSSLSPPRSSLLLFQISIIVHPLCNRGFLLLSFFFFPSPSHRRSQPPATAPALSPFLLPVRSPSLFSHFFPFHNAAPSSSLSSSSVATPASPSPPAPDPPLRATVAPPEPLLPTSEPLTYRNHQSPFPSISTPSCHTPVPSPSYEALLLSSDYRHPVRPPSITAATHTSLSLLPCSFSAFQFSASVHLRSIILSDGTYILPELDTPSEHLRRRRPSVMSRRRPGTVEVTQR
ncbi:uncharacterized protein LOC130980743 [Arachis stenosperma]|uniref:uncharacterized protein LOC130980743 n=1 Tax=Arachis stenosperma TaxID=217475 RepID=UPI0025AD7BA2|nr:uncharacterized protein LOC130980743 [Arachis stenosperma]